MKKIDFIEKCICVKINVFPYFFVYFFFHLKSTYYFLQKKLNFLFYILVIIIKVKEFIFTKKIN